MLSSLTDEYVRLLMDSRLLEERSVPVSSDERAMAAEEEKEATTAELKEKLDRSEVGEEKEVRKSDDKAGGRGSCGVRSAPATKKGTSAAAASGVQPRLRSLLSPLHCAHPANQRRSLPRLCFVV